VPMQEDPKAVNERIRQAVALMTAWNESDDGDTSFVTSILTEDFANAISSDDLIDVAIDKTTGLISLCGRLLLQLERSTKVPIEELLKRIGQQHAGDAL